MAYDSSQAYTADQTARQVMLKAVFADMAKTDANRGFNMDSFNQLFKEGDTYDQFVQRVQQYADSTKGDVLGLGTLKGGSYLADYLRKNKGKYESILNHAAGPRTGEGGYTGQADPNAPAPGDGMDARIADFARRMSGPLDMNDPEVKMVLAAGTNSAQKLAAGRGIRGGLSDAGVVKSGMDSLTGLSAHRNDLGMQALGLQSNRDLGLRNLDMQKYQMERDNSLASWKSQQASSQALGSAVGGGLGAVAGGYFGGPQGAAAGMQAGAGFGGGLAGSGTYTPPAYTPYKGGAY